MSVILKGEVKKWTGIMKGWSKRFFILREDMLEYFPSAKQQHKGKRIHLNVIEIIEVNKDLVIQLNIGTGTISMKFKDDKEKSKWIKNIRRAIDVCKKKMKRTSVMMVQSGAEAETEILSRKANIDIFYSRIKEKSQLCRDTLRMIKKTKVASNKKTKKQLEDLIEQMNLQINDIERFCCVNIEDMKNTIGMIYTEVKEAQEREIVRSRAMFDDEDKFADEIEDDFSRSSQFIDPNLSRSANRHYEDNVHFTQGCRNKGQTEGDFNGYLDMGGFQMVKRNTMGSKYTPGDEVICDASNLSPLKAGSEDDKEEAKFSNESPEEEKVSGEQSDSDDDSSVTFYDAYDHIIYDEFEKEVHEENKRRGTDFVLDHKRTSLPALKPKASINIFKILKDSIGKDLTKFCVPVYFNEPISMLQKVAEIMQNEDLISEAAEQKDPLKRLAYVTAFCIAQYGGTQFRCSKPFNPILGETFEFKHKGWKFIGEQVSHHPPISAGYVEHEKYEMWMNTHMRSKFWGKSLEFKPLGNINFKFRDNGDHFVCQRPNSSVQNIIIGNMYIDHSGESVVENINTGDKAVIKFKALGFFQSKKKRGQISASVMNAHGEEEYVVYGKWTDCLFIKPAGSSDDEGVKVWEFPEIPENWEQVYHFTPFTLQLNMINDHIKRRLPPTDARLRTDQRFLENGDFQKANDEKKRLEEKQRRRRKRMEKDNIEYKAKYFVKEEISSNGGKNKKDTAVEYRYVGDYWKDREEGAWDDMPNLFGPDTPEQSDEE